MANPWGYFKQNNKTKITLLCVCYKILNYFTTIVQHQQLYTNSRPMLFWLKQLSLQSSQSLEWDQQVTAASWIFLHNLGVMKMSHEELYHCSRQIKQSSDSLHMHVSTWIYSRHWEEIKSHFTDADFYLSNKSQVVCKSTSPPPSSENLPV